MAKVISARYHSDMTIENVVDDLINAGIPTEKILADEKTKTVKVITGTPTLKEIEEIFKRHKPEEITIHTLQEENPVETLTATYVQQETLANVVDDLINIGIPAEEILAVKETKSVKVIAPKVIEAEIKEVLQRHDPVRIE